MRDESPDGVPRPWIFNEIEDDLTPHAKIGQTEGVELSITEGVATVLDELAVDMAEILAQKGLDGFPPEGIGVKAGGSVILEDSGVVQKRGVGVLLNTVNAFALSMVFHKGVGLEMEIGIDGLDQIFLCLKIIGEGTGADASLGADVLDRRLCKALAVKIGPGDLKNFVFSFQSLVGGCFCHKPLPDAVFNSIA